MQQNEKAMNIVLDFDNYINAIRTVRKLYLSVVDLQVSTNVFKKPKPDEIPSPNEAPKAVNCIPFFFFVSNTISKTTTHNSNPSKCTCP